jgi:putative glutamine amidotransferase
VLYPEAVERAGGVPLIVPPLAPEILDSMMTRVDGICLPGGPDVEPENYGEEPDPNLGPTQPWADALGLEMVRAADRLGLPILAICRGLQVLNVARGGTLYQHLPDVVGESIAHRQFPHGSEPTHEVRVAEGTRVFELLGEGPLRVNSFHHQAVKDLGSDLVATGWAPDGMIETIEDPGERYVVGVQWHAEFLNDNAPLFEALVAEAAGRADRLAAMS